MKNYFTLLFIAIALTCYSQDEVEWFQEGQEWYYNVYCFQEYGCGYTYYEVNGSEIVDEKEASVLTRIYLDEIIEEPLVSAAYLTFENDTVWRFSTEADEWHFLYDIGAEVGDIWTIQKDVFYGYSDDGMKPDEIPLFKVVVDSVAFWEEVPNSPLTNRRVIYTSPINDGLEDSEYAFGPILEGVGPVGGSHDLIGNPAGAALPLQSPYFQCYLVNGELTYGSDELAYGIGSSPCFTLGTEDIQQDKGSLIYPNPAYDAIRWDGSIKALTIYDITGKVVLQNTQVFNIQSLCVGELNSGFYMVVVEKEKTLFSQKLIIER
ncbi:T9SS type A sorting domain-containing protein [Cryomorpha ignava]|uniref:T9SS type A sorting domain-containing protein n=1 Tax=Cryomorpha ignava TaxID=101383 RepID=A0A7K3WMG7_9FLAO|nr:T9SS type A sorting domain-containing protein [Cryomorpha ignava]NEN22843.1 T9SS type A sorting domain-containing protein [Cryomorpha ignava]